MEGEPRWDFKFIRRSLDDYNNIELFTILRTTQNKILTQSTGNTVEKSLEQGFPSKAEELFGYQGLIIGSVEANYFTPTQQQLIRDFVDRRGGGLLFTAGRATLSDGGYPGSPLEDLVPTRMPTTRGTFHRDFSRVELTPEGAQSMICRLDDDPARNAERWKKMPNGGELPGSGREKTWRVGAFERHTTGKRAMPLLVTENYGRGRTAVLASEGVWRWRCGLPTKTRRSLPSGSRCSATWLRTRPVSLPPQRPKTVLSDDTPAHPRGSARQGIQAGGQCQRAGPLHESGWHFAPPWN